MEGAGGLAVFEHVAAELAPAAGGSDALGGGPGGRLPAGWDSTPAAPARVERGARAAQPIEPAGPIACAPKEAHAMTAPVWGLELVRGFYLHTAAAAGATAKSRSGRPDTGGR